jgi:hypothetical protein
VEAGLDLPGERPWRALHQRRRGRLPDRAAAVQRDEVYAAMQVPGSNLGHAIRFILPNSRMASQGSGATKLYVHPASHAGGPSGPEAAFPTVRACACARTSR